MLDQYRKIPNILVEDNEAEGFEQGNRNIAMVIRNTPWLEALERNEGLNFEVVTVPSWEDLPHIEQFLGLLSLIIPKHSEHKEAAWSVVSYVASEEGKMYLSEADRQKALRFNYFIRSKANELLTSHKDVVTFFREMGEEYEVILEEMKGKD